MLQLLPLLLLMAICFSKPQVSYDIDREEDLLAVDDMSSSPAFVSVLPPPQSFLNQLPVQTVLPTPLPVRGTGVQRDKTLSYTNQLSRDGTYSFGYSTLNGSTRRERGKQTEAGYQVVGSYSYVGPNQVTYTVEYTADRHGFRPRISKSEVRKSSGRRKRRKLEESSRQKLATDTVRRKGKYRIRRRRKLF